MILDHLSLVERRLRASLLKHCADAVTHLSVSRGRAIYRGGDENRALYVLERGKVWIGQTSAAGKVMIYQVVKPGQIFADTALIASGMRDEEARAIEDSMYLSVPVTRVRKVLAAHPTMAADFLEFLSRRIVEARERVADLCFNSNPRRLAKMLLEEARSRGIRKKGAIQVRLGLTHEQLGQMIGTSREIVTSILNHFRDQSVIQYGAGIYTIFREKLEHYLGPVE